MLKQTRETNIAGTTKFNLCFQEVFQQIMTGIADFRRSCSSCWAHFQTTAGDCEIAWRLRLFGGMT